MTNELKNHTISIEEMKGLVTRNVLVSASNGTHTKAIVAITVISAKDYKPHAIISVIVNGNETPFGTNTKKAIEFYNQQ